MDDATVDVYERVARSWRQRRGESTDELGTRFRRWAGDGPVADLGCGTGRYLSEIGAPVIGIDASAAMLTLAGEHGFPLVRGDLECLPLSGQAFVGVFARHSFVHLPRARVPDAFAEARRVLHPGGLLVATLIEGTYEGYDLPNDDFPGRFFACWTAPDLAAALRSSGFSDVQVVHVERRAGSPDLLARARA